MTDEKRGGAPGAETTDIGAPGAPVRERRMTAKRKQEAVLRVLRGEPLETVTARELRVTAADLSPVAGIPAERGRASGGTRGRGGEPEIPAAR